MNDEVYNKFIKSKKLSNISAMLTLSWRGPLSYSNQSIDFAEQINGEVSI